MSLSRQGREVFNRLAEKPVKWLVKKRINPSILTLAGLLMTCVAVVFYYLARRDGVFMLYAGAALAVGSLLDGLDGAVARGLGVAGRKGAFTDSTVDRVEDSLTAVGIMLSGYVDELLVIVMLASSMLVSYTRARAEALGVSLAGVGLAERWLRLAILTVATAAAAASPEVLEAATAVVAVLSTLTVAQRIHYALKALD